MVYIVAVREHKAKGVTFLQEFQSEEVAWKVYSEMLDRYGFSGTHEVLRVCTGSMAEFLVVYPRFRKKG